VAAYIRTLSKKFEDAEALAAAEQKHVKIPEQRPFPPSEESIAKGKETYVSRCQECHGEQGEGSTTEKDDAGFPVIMQDFRSGVYKSGHNDADLVRTVLAGMPGTSMGSYGGEISV
jgi:cytochrome c